MASTTTLGEVTKVEAVLSHHRTALAQEVAHAGADTARGAYYFALLLEENNKELEQLHAIVVLTPP